MASETFESDALTVFNASEVKDFGGAVLARNRGKAIDCLLAALTRLLTASGTAGALVAAASSRLRELSTAATDRFLSEGERIDAARRGEQERDAFLEAIGEQLADWSLPVLKRLATLHDGVERVEQKLDQLIASVAGTVPTVRRPPFYVPFRRDAQFSGRTDELETIQRLLITEAPTMSRLVAIVGLAGVGKTQLAVEYCYEHRNSQPGGILWINAAEPWDEQLAALAERLGIREDATVSEGERIPRLISGLAEHLDAHPPALVVYDNVEDPRRLFEPIHGVLPAALAPRVLITTRVRHPDLVSLPLEGLSPRAALELLATSSGRQWLTSEADESRSSAAALCMRFGYLPLALVLVGAYLRNDPEISLEDYVQRIDTEGALATVDESGVDSLELPTRHDTLITSTLRLQMSALKDADAWAALRTAAVLGESIQIPRTRLALLTGMLDTAARGYPAKLGRALRKLHDLSLAEELTRHQVRLHPLVREFVLLTIEDRTTFSAACARRVFDALGELSRLDDAAKSRGIDPIRADFKIAIGLAAGHVPDDVRQLIQLIEQEAHSLRRGWTADGESRSAAERPQGAPSKHRAEDAKSIESAPRTLRRRTPANEPGVFLQQIRNRAFQLGFADWARRAEMSLARQGFPWLRQVFHAQLESAALVRTLEGHVADVRCVVATPDGRLISGSDDRTLKVWALEDGRAIRTLEGHIETSGGFLHTEGVLDVALMPGGRQLVSASRDATLKFWDIADGRHRHTCVGHTGAVTSVTFTPDGRSILSGSVDGTLRVWDSGTGRLARTLGTGKVAVHEVAVSPDGTSALSAMADGSVQLWDLARDSVVRTLQGHQGAVYTVAFTPDGRRGVSGSADCTLKVWDLSNGNVLHTLTGHDDEVSKVIVAAEGKEAVSASDDGTIRLWNIEQARATRQFINPSARGKRPQLYGARVGLALTSDSRFVISTAGAALKVWDISRAEEPRQWFGHQSSISAVTATPNSLHAVTAAGDRTLKVWDLATGNEVRTLEGHVGWVFDVSVTSDGEIAVSASKDGTVRVWNLSTGTSLGVIEPQLRPLEGFHYKGTGVHSVALARDGSKLVLGTRDATLRIWNLATSEEIAVLSGHSSSVTGAIITADEQRFHKPAAVEALAITLDGTRAISAADDCTLKVWDLGTLNALRTLVGHQGRVNDVELIGAGDVAISASDDGSLKLWALADGYTLATLTGHADRVMGVAMMPDGFTAASTSTDMSLKMWDLRTASCLATLQAQVSLECCATTPDGRFVLVGDEAGSLRVYEWMNPPTTRHLPDVLSVWEQRRAESLGALFARYSQDQSVLNELSPLIGGDWWTLDKHAASELIARLMDSLPIVTEALSRPQVAVLRVDSRAFSFGRGRLYQAQIALAERMTALDFWCHEEHYVLFHGTNDALSSLVDTGYIDPDPNDPEYAILYTSALCGDEGRFAIVDNAVAPSRAH